MGITGLGLTKGTPPLELGAVCIGWKFCFKPKGSIPGGRGGIRSIFGGGGTIVDTIEGGGTIVDTIGGGGTGY